MAPTDNQKTPQGSDATSRHRVASGLQLKLWLGVGLAVSTAFAALLVYQYRSARESALQHLLQEVRVVQEVLSISGQLTHQVMLDAGLPVTDQTLDLLPVHAFARIAKALDARRPGALRITLVLTKHQDPSERQDPMDAEAINFFVANPVARERIAQSIDAEGHGVLAYTQPVWTQGYCLGCHGEGARLPKTLRERRPPAFGYRAGELFGILSFRLPIEQLRQETLALFWHSLGAPLSVFATLFLVGGALLQRVVIGRIRNIQGATQSLAAGDYQARLEVGGQDELSDLAQAFNQMADKIAARDQRLSESEERLRLFVDHAPVALAMLDRDMRYLACSKRWLSDYGIAEPSLVGRSHDEVFPKVPQRWRQAYRRGLAGEVVKSMQDAVSQLDGSLRWVRWEVRPWHTADCAVGGIVVFTEDITERKRAEEALKQANGHNRALLEASLDPLVVIDGEGHISDVNGATEQATGMPREDLIGADFADYFSDPEQARAGCRAAFEEGEVRDYALELKHRDGTTTPVLYNARVYRDPGGAVEQVFAAARDVTAIKRLTGMLEARLRLLNNAEQWSLEEILRATLDEAAELTNSAIGFYHFLERDQETLALQTWSTRTLTEFCRAEGSGLHYALSEAGVWADCVRERRPIVHNDYPRLPHRSGLPEGHADVKRELVVPVTRDDRIVAILGVGNKPRDYGDRDLEIVATFADLAWDIVERKRTESALRASEASYRRIVETATEGIWSVDAENRTTFVNARMAEMLGLSADAMIGRPLEDFLFEEDKAAHRARNQAAQTGDGRQYEVRLRHRDGSELWVLVASARIASSEQAGGGSFAMLTDISLLKEQQKRLERMAHFDTLTGLPNRAMLADRLHIGMAQARRNGTLLAVCYLDLDDFKPVNDTYGHAVGDRLLIAVAERLSGSLREVDTAARLGGDELVVLLGDMARHEQCLQSVQRMSDTLAAPYEIAEAGALQVSVSIGVTLYPLDASDADTLLRHADRAMYQAKQAGRNCMRLFEAEARREPSPPADSA
ncbi:PAS domain S-box protein [Thiorhodococcus minor]|uniref:PAS domain S-box protein n=1 Tax=Thiorhodococcus minor TaxID=57489 RepID=A0A6M0JYN0_9GAMM|nr:PAS domain S-box protein [Thiorhodococcus minor]NEV62618.1 PAS domain S-box protein [Thiorhodococcus minor]